jgi:cobalt-zinc-cadmium efflux system outer membrane protein
LPLWNRNGGNIKAAQASVEQFEWAAGKVRTQMEADIANAEAAYKEAHERWLNYREQTAPKSAKVRESVAFAYEKGGASLVDLLDAERTDNDIRLATVQAMSDTASAAADMTAARNVLPQREIESRK